MTDAAPPNQNEEAQLRHLMQLLRKVNEDGEQEQVVGEFRIARSRIPERHLETVARLTKTEVAVMRFLGWGRSNADIATLLAIQENTVRVHLNNMCQKLELDGVRELSALAGLMFHPLT